MKAIEYRPGPQAGTVLDPGGAVVKVPAGWVLLPPGDPGLTRRTKAAGEYWTVAERKGRKLFSRGLYAPATTIERLRAELLAERGTEAYAKKQAASSRRRQAEQAEYEVDFRTSILQFLAFHERHAAIAGKLADAVTTHAVPVGSGTVARTKRIPIEQRAEAAVIAWMRHQTTGYDRLVIPRVRGKRREVRRMLAEHSRGLLARYRSGSAVETACPLAAALVKSPAAGDAGT